MDRVARLGIALGLLVPLAGCVMKSTYNTMLAQQKSIESSLQREINADQVEIEELKDGIAVHMSAGLLYREGSVELSRDGMAALDKVAPQFAAETYEIDVVGNTDSLPVARELAERYPTNWELAGARAAMVVRHLERRQVDPVRMRAISAGQYHPVASNDTEAGRAKNRRTSVVLRPR